MARPQPGKRCVRLLDRSHWLVVIAQDRRFWGHATAVAAVLAKHCNGQTGACFPSLGTIARAIGSDPAGVCRSLKKLERAGAIQRVKMRGGRNQYDLLMPELSTSDICRRRQQSVGRGDNPGLPSTTTDYCPPRQPNSVVTTGQKNQKNSTAGSAAAIPADWRPSDHGQRFAIEHGMPDAEIDRQAELFICHNRDRRVTHENWCSLWERWVLQWERHRIEAASRKDDRRPGETRAKADIRRVLERGEKDRPCWARFGSEGFDPTGDPERFVRSGCSRVGSCLCNATERREILDRMCPQST